MGQCFASWSLVMLSHNGIEWFSVLFIIWSKICFALIAQLAVEQPKVLASNLNTRNYPFVGFIARAHEWTILLSHG